MTIGLQGTGCDIELEIIKETDKAYQVCNITGNKMWFPKSAFNKFGELTEFGQKLYKEKCDAVKQESMIDKQNTFSTELSYIINEDIRNWTIKAINSLPTYTFTIAASSTGKYHPNYALGSGGLIRHIKAATGIAYNLFQLYNFTDEQKDIIIVALILHDGLKNGINNSPFTVHDHPLIICNHLRQQEFFNDITQAEQICEGISSHMGQWATNKKSKVVLPLPETEVQKFIHLCDYLASRKCLEFVFPKIEISDIIS
jgi:hypothetical protein